MTHVVQFSYLNQPSLILLEEKDPASEIATEIFYSEEISIEDEGNGWFKVTCYTDNYSGYCNDSKISYVTSSPFPLLSTETIAKVSALYGYVYSKQDTVNKPIATIPFEGKIRVLENSHPRWIHVELLNGSTGYIQRGQVTINKGNSSIQDVLEFAKTIAASASPIPYYFGGRSMPTGYDCSGFVQMLYRQIGVPLPRNARDQAKATCLSEVPTSDAQSGDLIFFAQTSDQPIRHVGIMLDNTKFVHANPQAEVEKPNRAGCITISSITQAPWNSKCITIKRLKGG
jgi:hypothetical protein